MRNTLPTRRQAMQHSAAVAALLAATGLWPRPARAFNQAAFSATTQRDALKALGQNAAALSENPAVRLEAPDIAENGGAVPVALSATALPGVQRMLLLIENNPWPLAAVFDVREPLRANFSTRVKMADSSDIYAVALTADGKAHFARKLVRVTLGGCGV